jgi:hypothetical protein
METGGGGGEVCQEVASRGQFSSLRGARRWQRHPILALPGGCRAEKLMCDISRYIVTRQDLPRQRQVLGVKRGQQHGRQQVDPEADVGRTGVAELLWGLPSFGRVAPQEVEV